MGKSFLKIIAICLTVAVLLPLLASCDSDSDSTVKSSESESRTESVPSSEITDTSDASDEVSQNSSEQENKKEGVSVSMLEGKTPCLIDGAYTVKDLSYGSRVDMSTAESKASSQIFDLYLPAALGEIPNNAPVFLYVHGGAWSDANYVKDTDNTWLCHELAQSGMVVFSMNYVLAGSRNSGDSVDDMIKDIDTMLAHAKKLLSEMGVSTGTCGIGGTSAGGHLSALYAYRYGNKAPIRIGYEADIVGPVDLMTYKPLIDSYIKLAGSLSAFSQFGGNSFTGIFGSMAGMKNLTEADLPKLWEKMNECSPVNYVTKDSCPTILLYGKRTHQSGDMMPSDIESDGLVPISCYDNLVGKLKANGVVYTDKVYEGYGHGDLPWKSPAKEWITEQIIKFAGKYAK